MYLFSLSKGQTHIANVVDYNFDPYARQQPYNIIQRQTGINIACSINIGDRLKISTGCSEAVNRRTDNAMAKRKWTQKQTKD